MQTIKDPLTGQPFIKKRNNQKFSSPRNRAIYNNQLAKVERDFLAQANLLLRENLRLLNKLIQPNEVKTFSRNYLIKAGYAIQLTTHTERYGDINCHALYNYVLLDLMEDKPTITIFRKQFYSI